MGKKKGTRKPRPKQDAAPPSPADEQGADDVQTRSLEDALSAVSKEARQLTIEALNQDGATSVTTLKSVPFRPETYKATHVYLATLGVAKPVERAMIKKLLTDMQAVSTTTTDGGGDHKARSDAALQKLGALKQLKEGFQPFIDEAARAEQGARTKQEVAEKKAVDSAKAKAVLLSLGLELPEAEHTVAAATGYLDREIGKLTLVTLQEQPDLDVVDLVDRNELLQCVHLRHSGAGIAPSPVGQLRPGSNPFKNPRGASYRLMDKDVETTTQHARMTQIDETLGSSWSAAASTQGAAFIGAGVGAWSASVSGAGAKQKATTTKGSKTSEKTTHIKVTQAIMTCAQFCLADRDWALTPEFERSLVEIKETVGNADQVRRDRLLKVLLDEYGSHLCTQAVLGGRYKIECHVTAVSGTQGEETSAAVADALNARASAGAAAAGFGGAGTASVSGSTELETSRQAALAVKGKDYSKDTMMSMVVTGGVPGDMATWLNDLRKSNRGWEVVDRDPNQGLRPIWNLVFKSELVKDEAERQQIAYLIEECYHSSLKHALADKYDEQMQQRSDSARLQWHADFFGNAGNPAEADDIETFSEGAPIRSSAGNTHTLSLKSDGTLALVSSKRTLGQAEEGGTIVWYSDKPRADHNGPFTAHLHKKLGIIVVVDAGAQRVWSSPLPKECGVRWTLRMRQIAGHNNELKNWWPNNAPPDFNLNHADPSARLFANFADLDHDRDNNDKKLEFQLVWPRKDAPIEPSVIVCDDSKVFQGDGKVAQSQRWKQETNPTDDRDAAPAGYEAIHCPHTLHGWCGLHRGNPAQRKFALLTGAKHQTDWWYALGSYGPIVTTHTGRNGNARSVETRIEQQMLGPSDKKVDRVELYSRVHLKSPYSFDIIDGALVILDKGKREVTNSKTF